MLGCRRQLQLAPTPVQAFKPAPSVEGDHLNQPRLQASGSCSTSDRLKKKHGDVLEVEVEVEACPWDIPQSQTQSAPPTVPNQIEPRPRPRAKLLDHRSYSKLKLKPPALMQEDTRPGSNSS